MEDMRGIAGMRLRFSAGLCLIFTVAALLHGTPARAQLPPPAPPPKVDPRRGPRLEYKKGPAQCLTELDFRSEVAIPLDGVDHLAADSPDVVRVWFEKSLGGYRGTFVHTNAEGEAGEPYVITYYNCEIAGRWLAEALGRQLIPRAPRPPPPEPCPLCPACRVCSTCPTCPTCGTTRPSILAPCPQKFLPMDLTVGLSTYVMMSAFLTADVAPAFGLGVDVGGETLFARLEFRGVLPSRAYARELIPGATSGLPVEMDLSQITALLVPCARYKYFVGCGVAQFGVLLMSYELGQGKEAAVGFGPRIGFEVPFAERFAVFGFGEVLFAANRAIIEFSRPPQDHPELPRANTQWVQPLASGFFGAGVAVKFK